MKYFVALFLTLLGTVCFAQKEMLVYDLISQRVDTLAIPNYDASLTSDRTSAYIGEYSTGVASFPRNTPTSNVYPTSNFTYKRRADLDFNIEDFPLRSAVKLFSVSNDSLVDLCSGMMISTKHVLTAAHCVCAFNSDSLVVDSVIAIPAYNNGEIHPVFGMSAVQRVYIFKGMNVATDDMAILELNRTLGYATGWIGIGYQENDTLLLDGNMYKLSYPALTNTNVDPKEYNGDTLFYNYGVVNFASSTNLGISGTSGIAGESGSSLLKIDSAGSEVTSYGTLTFSNSLVHSRIVDWQYYSLYNVIANALSQEELSVSPESRWSVYPNPSSSIVFLQGGMGLAHPRVEVYSVHGQLVGVQVLESTSSAVRLPEIQGIYVLSIYDGNDKMGSVRVVVQP